MSWDIIDARLDRHEYWDLNTFKVGKFLYCVVTKLMAI